MGHISHLSHIAQWLKIFYKNMNLIPFYGPNLPIFHKLDFVQCWEAFVYILNFLAQ
jgi:hypothetical protein